jgi:RNA polymerase sigma factor (sigma-70 family)
MNFFTKLPDDQDLISGIFQDSPRRRIFEDKLYRKYEYLIKEGLFKHKLDEDESSIAYSDAVLSVIENIQKGVFEERSSLKTYIHRIFSNKCVDQIRKNTTKREQVNTGDSVDEYLNRLTDTTKSIVEELMQQHESDLLWKCLDQLGDKCKTMIRSWSEGRQDKEIAVDMGYQSAEVVKTSRLRCLDKLRGLFTVRYTN